MDLVGSSVSPCAKALKNSVPHQFHVLSPLPNTKWLQLLRSILTRTVLHLFQEFPEVSVFFGIFLPEFRENTEKN